MNKQEYRKIIDGCLEISDRKNNDYTGAGRIDNIQLTGPYGVAVRLLDKVCRLLSLLRPDVKRMVKDESVRDTALDLINYGVFIVMLLDGTWNEKESVSIVTDQGGNTDETDTKNK